MIHTCGSLQVSYFCSHGCESQNLECTSLELPIQFYALYKHLDDNVPGHGYVNTPPIINKFKY